MLRLCALLGIGFMLVGVLAYCLPQQQEIYWRIPVFIGFLTSAKGFERVNPDGGLTVANVVALVLLAAYSVVRLIPTSTHLSQNYIEWIADLSLIGYAVILLYAARKSVQAK